MALINLNDATPAAPSGFQNAKWQADSSSPRNVSAYIPGTGGVAVKTADYTAVAADCGKLIVFNSSVAHTLTLPAGAPFAQWNISVQNIGTGIVTISPNGLTIDGAGSSLTLAQTQGLAISTDATNYFSERGAINITPSLGGVSVKTADYTAVAGDTGKLLVMNSGSTHTITLPSSPPSSTWVIAIQNVGAGTLAISRGGLTIDTVASDLSLTTGQGVLLWCDGSNYFTERSSLPASPADATKFLNGASAPAFAQVKDSDLAVSDVTTNNVSTAKHGLAPKAPNDATKFLDGTGSYSAPSALGGAALKTTSYSAVAGDNGKILSFNSASALTLTLASPPPSGTWNVRVQNVGSGALTVSPNGLTLDASSSSVTLTQNQGLYISTDGSNYFTERGISAPSSYPYDVVFSYVGQPSGGATVFLLIFDRTVTFSGNLAGSYGKCGTNPASTAVFSILKNGTSAGSISIATGGVFTFSTTGGASLSFSAGDVMKITAPNPQDASLADVSVIFAGTR